MVPITTLLEFGHKSHVDLVMGGILVKEGSRKVISVQISLSLVHRTVHQVLLLYRAQPCLLTLINFVLKCAFRGRHSHDELVRTALLYKHQQMLVCIQPMLCSLVQNLHFSHQLGARASL